jgi:hypothetical protein
MLDHHPALAETGELEIAQRHALNVAKTTLNHSGAMDLGALHAAQVAVDAYLRAMRAAYTPEAIVIGEGDHVIVEIDGHAVRVEHRTRDGAPLLVVDPEGATYLEGTEPGVYMLSRIPETAA